MHLNEAQITKLETFMADLHLGDLHFMCALLLCFDISGHLYLAEV